jgi:hypothetical protein
LAPAGKRHVASPRVLLVLGKDSANVDEYWLASGAISEVVRLERAVPSGLRFGNRLLGLGLDSVALALKAVVLRKGGRYLAANPWIAVALRLLGVRDIAVTGLYASPGSRSFRVLRQFLKDAVVVTTVQIEADAWNDAGGRAAPVLYGNNFGYPRRLTESPTTLTIFIGGSSDRDSIFIETLEKELMSGESPVFTSLIVVANDQPSITTNDFASVEHTGYVSAQRFGELLASSDVVILPLRPNGRAAGHMVTVGALEAGVPVLTTTSRGMEGYVDGTYVQYLNPELPLLPQASKLAALGLRERANITEFWQTQFSRGAYVNRVARALSELDTA